MKFCKNNTRIFTQDIGVIKNKTEDSIRNENANSSKNKQNANGFFCLHVLYKSPLRYFNPESTITVTILFPAPIILALCMAAHTFAPDVVPPNIPSILASFLAVSKASSSDTAIISSANSNRHITGTNPGPIPSNLCVPDILPLESDLTFNGSIGIQRIFGILFLNTSALPEKQPPVPTPMINSSISVPRTSKISHAML